EGPEDIDLAVADFANRMSRFARYSYDPLDLSRLATASGEIVSAAKASFRNFSLTDPRSVALPVQVALSLGSLMAESALRGLVTFDVVGPARMPRLVSDFFEMFTETPVFAGLEYGDLIEKCENRLAVDPNDHRARLELARLLSKCGRYEDADIEFKKIPGGAPQYAVARHEAAVALYRAGRYLPAVKSEVDALHADPKDERSRAILFLSADKLGGYPEFVPEPFRISIKAGWAKPAVEFEDVAAKVGLDKTSGGRGSAIFDYNNDGYLDIVLGAAYGGTQLYHNNGDGTFTDVSIDSGVDIAVNTFATIAADYDNDGNVDLYCTRQGFYVGE